MAEPTIDRGPPPLPAAPREMDGVESLRLVPRIAPLAGAVVEGMLLTLVTFGIYRFWYRTRLRRYYWNNTTLAGDGFEYTGTGKELFVGFLIAIAIIVPINFAATIAGLVAGPVVGTGVGVVVAFVLFPALIQIALYRARRYRLSRTRYRGVRFAQTGTGTAYLVHSIKWLVLSLVTFGLVVPYWRTALARYRIDHTWFGDLQGRFDGKAHPLMKRWLVLWANLAAVFLLAAVAAYQASVKAEPTMILIWSGLALLVACLIPITWQAYKVAEFRAFTGATTFGAVRLTSDLRTGAVIWAWMRYGLAVFAMLFVPVLIFTVLAYMRGDFSNPQAFSEEASGFLAGLAPVLILAFVVFSSVVTELVLRRRIWILKVRSITVFGIDAIASVLQRAADGLGAVGEAFDTDFDIAG